MVTGNTVEKHVNSILMKLGLRELARNTDACWPVLQFIGPAVRSFARQPLLRGGAEQLRGRRVFAHSSDFDKKPAPAGMARERDRRI